MARHLWAFALVLVIVGAPLAPALCGVLCASHDMAMMAGHGEHHSCHPASTDSVAATPAAHACGHQNDGVVGLEQLVQVLNPPAVVESPMTVVAAIDMKSHVPCPALLEQSPPGLLALIAPLRI